MRLQLFTASAYHVCSQQMSLYSLVVGDLKKTGLKINTCKNCEFCDADLTASSRPLCAKNVKLPRDWQLYALNITYFISINGYIQSYCRVQDALRERATQEGCQENTQERLQCLWQSTDVHMLQGNQMQWVCENYSGQDTIPTADLIRFLQEQAQVWHFLLILRIVPCAPCTVSMFNFSEHKLARLQNSAECWTFCQWFEEQLSSYCLYFLASKSYRTVHRFVVCLDFVYQKVSS